MCGTHIYLFNSIHGSQKRKNSKDKNNNHLFLKLVRVPSSVPVLLQYHLYYYTTTELYTNCTFSPLPLLTVFRFSNGIFCHLMRGRKRGHHVFRKWAWCLFKIRMRQQRLCRGSLLGVIRQQRRDHC